VLLSPQKKPISDDMETFALSPRGKPQAHSLFLVLFSIGFMNPYQKKIHIEKAVTVAFLFQAFYYRAESHKLAHVISIV